MQQYQLVARWLQGQIPGKILPWQIDLDTTNNYSIPLSVECLIVAGGGGGGTSGANYCGGGGAGGAPGALHPGQPDSSGGDGRAV